MVVLAVVVAAAGVAVWKATDEDSIEPGIEVVDCTGPPDPQVANPLCFKFVGDPTPEEQAQLLCEPPVPDRAPPGTKPAGCDPDPSSAGGPTDPDFVWPDGQEPSQ